MRGPSVSAVSRCRHFATVGLSLAIVVSAIIAIVTRVLVTPDSNVLKGWTLQNRDLTRLVLVGFVSVAAMLALYRRETLIRRFGLTSLVALTILGLALIVRGAVQTWPVGDGAMIELYTIHAAHGTQMLGAYSQYGWHHPGPLLFYLLAPLYVLGGRSVAALDAGALMINLVSIAAIAWVLARRASASAVLVWTVLSLLLLYVLRLPSLLTSAWNPHAPLLAFAALLMTAAAVLAGDVALLPAVAVLASFITQAHVGYAPVSVVLVVLTFTAVVTIHHRTEKRGTFIRSMVMAVGLLEVVWLLPLVEQLSAPTGNMTLIFRFFSAGGPTPSVSVAWRVWGNTLVAAFLPGFMPPQGWAVPEPPVLSTALLGTTAVTLLVPITMWAWRRRDHFACALAIVCFFTSLIGFGSILQVRGPIGDYQVFWLSVVGLMNVSLAVTALLTAFLRDMTSNMVDHATSVASAVFVIIPLVVGCRELVAARTSNQMDADNVAVRNLTQQILERFPSTGNHRPLIRFDAGMWPAATGIVLQMARASITMTVDSDNPVAYASRPDLTGVVAAFGRSFLTTGNEDALLTVCHLPLHEKLSRRPNNVLLAYDEKSRVYVDEISLVDAPQYRVIGSTPD